MGITRYPKQHLIYLNNSIASHGVHRQIVAIYAEKNICLTKKDYDWKFLVFPDMMH